MIPWSKQIESPSRVPANELPVVHQCHHPCPFRHRRGVKEKQELSTSLTVGGTVLQAQWERSRRQSERWHIRRCSAHRSLYCSPLILQTQLTWRRVGLVVPPLTRKPRECRGQRINDDEKAVDPTYKRDGARASHRSLRVTGDGSSAGWAASASY
jgi:hypothetical protein